MIFGIGYKMRQGKDTIANYLVEKYGFVRIGFADALKREVSDSSKVLIWLKSDLTKAWFRKTDKIFEEADDILLAEVIDFYNHHKNDFVSCLGADSGLLGFYGRDEKHRGILQFWGTNYRRRFDNDYWVNKVSDVVSENKQYNYAISDLRFKNEYAFIKANDGITIKVSGRKIEDESGLTHQSEVDLKNIVFDYNVNNSSDFDFLYSQIDVIVDRELNKGLLK